MKNIGAELAEKIIERFQSEDIKQLLVDTKAAADDDTGTFEVIITTENLDRYREVIKLDGWELEHYVKNPIVLWGHDHNQPIGVATSVEIIDGKMVARGKFAPNEKGQEVRRLYDFGIIRATSVGFIEKEREGNVITKAELLEFSFVSVPANPYALSLAMEKGLSIDGLVTKGFMVVGEKSEEDPEPVADPQEDASGEEEEPVEVTIVPEEEDEVTPDERSFSVKQIDLAVGHLKSAIVALEALGEKSEEPEGDEAAEVPEEEKDFDDFASKRRLLQEASTVLGEVLAEARQYLDAQRAS